MKKISVIGVPLDLGQARRGVDMGPSAIRYAGMIERLECLGYEVDDLGDLYVERPKKQEVDENPKLKNLKQIVKVCTSVAEKVDRAIEQGSIPLVLGGDHSLAIGTLAGVTKHFSNLGVIWFDAHGDLNTEEITPSGNIHGMPLAVNLGYGPAVLTHLYGGCPKIKRENVVIIGARALDDGEKEFIRTEGIKVFTMHEVDRLGMAAVMEEALRYLSHTDGIHLSLDLDGLDPHDAPGVGTPVIGGLSYREGHLAMEMLAECNRLTSAEFVEINPILDERNKTAIAAVALMGSLFGEKLK